MNVTINVRLETGQVGKDLQTRLPGIPYETSQVRTWLLEKQIYVKLTFCFLMWLKVLVSPDFVAFKTWSTLSNESPIHSSIYCICNPERKCFWMLEKLMEVEKVNHRRVMRKWKNQEHQLSPKIIAKHRLLTNTGLTVTSLMWWCNCQMKVQCLTEEGRLYGRYLINSKPSFAMKYIPLTPE